MQNPGEQMKRPDNNDNKPLDNPALERLAALLGEFLARTWLKKTKNDDIRQAGLSSDQELRKSSWGSLSFTQQSGWMSTARYF